MTNVIRGEINHKVINKLVRDFKGKVAEEIHKHIRDLRTEITNILNDEDNVAVFIYISDEAADPIHLQMGNGENELVINVEETGIKYVWTKKTYWKMTTDFLKNVVNTIVDRIGSIVSSALVVGTSPMKSIKSK